MQCLKADTLVKVVIGPVVAVGDGFTPVTTLSLSTADEAELIKHDAAAVTDISGNTFAAITFADGYYNLTLTAAQLDTEGMLTVLVNDDSLCLPVKATFMVMNANAYDSFYAAAGTDTLQADLTEIGGVAQSATDLKDFADEGYDPATNAVQNVASLGADAVDATALATSAVNEINATVDVALADIGLDHLLSAAVIGTDVTDNSVIAQLVSSSATADWDDFVNTTDALQAIRDRGDAAWTTGGGGSDPALLQNTTIATLASQTSFTLTAGSTDDDAYNGCIIVVTDSVTSTQKAVGVISDYTGSTRTVTLLNDPAVFTMAVGDTVDVIADRSVKPVTDNRTLVVDANGRADVSLIEGVDATDQINAACDAAIADAGLDHLVGAAVVGADVTDNSIVARLVSKSATADWDDFDNTTDSLQAQRDSQVLFSGTADSGTTTTLVDAALTEADTDYWARNVVRFTSGNLAGQTAYITAFTPGTDTVTFSPAVTQAVTTHTYEILPFGVEVFDSASDEVTVSAYNASLDFNATQKASINTEADTAIADANLDHVCGTATGIPAIVAGTYLDQMTRKAAGTFNRETDSLEAQTDNDFNATQKASINTEVDDVLATDTRAELSAVPAANADLAEKINWIFMMMRNQLEQTATTLTLRADDTTTQVAQSTVSDSGGTATRGEFA